jgi:hypothetical protein
MIVPMPTVAPVSLRVTSAALALGIVLALPACGDKAKGGGGGGDDSTTAADASSGGGQGETAQTQGTGLEHGVVQLQFRRAEGQATDPFVDTVHIEITLDYLGCLVDFYAGSPEYAQDGVVGARVFGPLEAGGEGWMDRLCDTTDVEAAPCQVVRIEQELVSAQHLRVVYEMTGDIEDRWVNFGPLPTAGLAACADGDQPRVRIAANGNIRGLAANGDLVWVTRSFDPEQAVTDQGQAFQIRGRSSQLARAHARARAGNRARATLRHPAP